uniref:Uncharacterized protein n=1 Tax=Arundo donax TaxID=35708 RepID=A0A0A9BMH3_ARUDO
MRTAPIPFSLASVSTMKILVKSGRVKTGVWVSFLLSS